MNGEKKKREIKRKVEEGTTNLIPKTIAGNDHEGHVWTKRIRLEERHARHKVILCLVSGHLELGIAQRTAHSQRAQHTPKHNVSASLLDALTLLRRVGLVLVRHTLSHKTLRFLPSNHCFRIAQVANVQSVGKNIDENGNPERKRMKTDVVFKISAATAVQPSFQP